MKAIRSQIRSLVALFAFMTPSLASAQTTPAGNPWSHGTTLNVFAGVGSDSSQAATFTGAAVGWEVTPRFAVEGSGSWFDQGQGAKTFAADLKALLSLETAHGFVPFVEGGVGLYRASFDLSQSVIPDFYRRRIPAAASGLSSASTFTDPSFIVGCGVNLFLTHHVAIQPDVQAKVVRRARRNYVMTTVAVHLAYHFEEHPVAPVRSRHGTPRGAEYPAAPAE